MLSFLLPATKLGQGNIFTGVCDSVNRGGGVSARGEGDCSRGVCSQGGVCSPRDSHCCGRYASYWNAFLKGLLFTGKGLNFLDSARSVDLELFFLLTPPQPPPPPRLLWCKNLYVSLQLLMQNWTTKWHFPLNFRTATYPELLLKGPSFWCYRMEISKPPNHADSLVLCIMLSK